MNHHEDPDAYIYAVGLYIGVEVCVGFGFESHAISLRGAWGECP